MTVTSDTFLNDVRAHQLHVLKDDGVYRHLRFKRPDSSAMHFELVTWPGHLSYSGDMGSFTFSRLTDMFEFFRREASGDLRINPCYWSEKLVAADRQDGFKEFCQEKFERALCEHVFGWMREHRTETTAYERRELWGAVKDEVLSLNDDSSGSRRQAAAHDFIHRVNKEVGNFYFRDFWETDVAQFTDRFVWCCYALTWGVAQYDQATQPLAANL